MIQANVFLVFFQGYTSFLSPFDVASFVVDYVQLPVFLIMYLGWKFWHKTKFIKAADIDLNSDRRTGEEEQELERTDDWGRAEGATANGDGGPKRRKWWQRGLTLASRGLA